MTRRLRTAWLEMAAGFHLLFAAVSAFDQAAAAGGGPDRTPESMAVLLLAAGCAVFLLHAVRAVWKARRFLFAFAAAAALFGEGWFASIGWIEVAVVQAFFGAWLACGALFPWADPVVGVEGERPLRGLTLLTGGALLFLALPAALGSGGTPGRAIAAACLAAAGGFLLWTELEGHAPLARRMPGAHRDRWRPFAIAAACAVLAFESWRLTMDGQTGGGGIMLSLLAFLLLSIALDPEKADDLSGATPRQREIYAHERLGEGTLWLIFGAAAFSMSFLGGFRGRPFFIVLLLVALVSLVAYRFRPARALTERQYRLTVIGIIVSTLALSSVTGGFTSPFSLFAFVAVFSSAFIMAAAWPLVAAAVFAACVLAEMAWVVAADGPVGGLRLSRYLFQATALLSAGIYVHWAARRRERFESSLTSANRRLAEALQSAVRERERIERQARDLKSLNADLIEMRSALLNVLEDVEESKRQIEAERRREAAIFDALAEGVVAAGKDGRIILCNPTAARILGVPAERVIGEPIERVIRLFREDSVVLQTGAFEAAYAGRTAPLGSRLLLARPDGLRVPVSGTVASFLDAEGGTTGVVAAFRDVTVEREIDRQKSDFISIASHQLRTPLSALRWFLDLLLAGDAGGLKPKQKEYLGDMSVSIVRMIKLVGDLLNISRIESGRVRPEPEIVGIPDFVGSLVKEFAPLVKQQDVTFTSSVAEDARTFYADPGLARQAIANVLSNALKYTPAGGKVTFDVSVKGPEAVFRVRDTGIGIPKNQQYRIFAKFFRGENVIAQETVGSGLGLYVVKTIMDLSGGRVWFESEEKKGTVFSLAFPTAPKTLPTEILQGKT